MLNPPEEEADEAAANNGEDIPSAAIYSTLRQLIPKFADMSIDEIDHFLISLAIESERNDEKI